MLELFGQMSVRDLQLQLASRNTSTALLQHLLLTSITVQPSDQSTNHQLRVKRPENTNWLRKAVH
jgi:hypothetical protein